jgi:hypothetical protein
MWSNDWLAVPVRLGIGLRQVYQIASLAGVCRRLDIHLAILKQLFYQFQTTNIGSSTMRVLALTLFLMLSVVCAPALGQSELQEKQKAVVVFDVRMDMIRDCALGKTLKLEDKLNAMHAQSGDNGPNPSKLERIFGAMSAPEDMASAMSIQMGDMPMEFFVRMKFKDADSAKAILAEAEKDNGGTVEKDGKTFYKAPPSSGMPEGLLMHAVDDTTVEMGTEAYVFMKNRTPFTDNLKAAWEKSPNEAIRIAMDLQGAKGLISEAVEMGKQQGGGNPMVGVYLDLVDNMKDVGISLDFSGKNLLTIRATGVNDSDAVELKEGLDSLLGMAKMGGQTQLPNIKQMDPEGGAVLEKILNSLNAKSEGTDVSVVIPKPEGFDKAVENAVNQFGAMFGGGGFAPPGVEQPEGDR